jgi:outer membrane lipoprotein
MRKILTTIGKRRLLAGLAAAISMTFFACAPVLSGDMMRAGDRTVSFAALRQNPTLYKGRLFIFGGVIIQTKLTNEGSEIEAMEAPVDRYGYFEAGRSQGRFIATMTKDQGTLDPLIYQNGKSLTLAAEFLEIRKGKIDQAEYEYPVFKIRQLYLWSNNRGAYPPSYYGPWYYPYPYFYWGVWWNYPYARPLPGPPHGPPLPPPLPR